MPPPRPSRVVRARRHRLTSSTPVAAAQALAEPPCGARSPSSSTRIVTALAAGWGAPHPHRDWDGDISGKKPFFVTAASAEPERFATERLHSLGTSGDQKKSFRSLSVLIRRRVSPIPQFRMIKKLSSRRGSAARDRSRRSKSVLSDFLHIIA